MVNGVGDLQIEFSMEYRRYLTEALELAWFVDAGNVWLFANSNSSALQALNWNSVALGSGLGIRVDFDFFLLRIDGALRVHDPSVNASGAMDGYVGTQRPSAFGYRAFFLRKQWRSLPLDCKMRTNGLV